AIHGGCLEQLPPVEDRLGVDVGRAIARRLDQELEVRGVGRGPIAEAPEDRPRYHERPRLQRPQRVLVLVQVQDVREVVVEARDLWTGVGGLGAGVAGASSALAIDAALTRTGLGTG